MFYKSDEQKNFYVKIAIPRSPIFFTRKHNFDPVLFLAKTL
jgi:hypothetical protein